ncbi:MAG: response regulator [bacterium]|nr:response regulator [bacterium]
MKEKKEKILVVDDDSNILTLLQFHLEKTGYLVKLAKDGKQALSIMKKDKIDLVISDMMMPAMDGLELCKRVKSEPLWKSCPVIMLTARTQPSDREKGKEAGVDKYIAKPFQVKELLNSVKNNLKLYSNKKQ